MTRAGPNDWFVVAQLVEALWAGEAGFDPRIASDPAPALSAVEDSIRLIREGAALIAWAGERPIGLLGVKPGAYHGKHAAARAPFFWVDPAHRNGSAARRLWEAAQTVMGEQPVQIWVSAGNAKYARVMQRWFGFKPVATIYERGPGDEHRSE